MSIITLAEMLEKLLDRRDICQKREDWAPIFGVLPKHVDQFATTRIVPSAEGLYRVRELVYRKLDSDDPLRMDFEELLQGPTTLSVPYAARIFSWHKTLDHYIAWSCREAFDKALAHLSGAEQLDVLLEAIQLAKNTAQGHMLENAGDRSHALMIQVLDVFSNSIPRR